MRVNGYHSTFKSYMQLLDVDLKTNGRLSIAPLIYPMIAGLTADEHIWAKDYGRGISASKQQSPQGEWAQSRWMRQTQLLGKGFLAPSIFTCVFWNVSAYRLVCAENGTEKTACLGRGSRIRGLTHAYLLRRPW
ncbi:hypothetical protein AG1IA_04106 [Rhizoctonia solani AG-1 IA]|uniref:Uncharacterized protein n=1 Tax=Thanatephorus cucumeris (strain AG1-IA) TaxID=983506 RepID=L8WV46_THACA|nr:hypothetical protein AG1IA_04106 [Rhizoctonia solani AG-1 IA]